MIRVKQNVNGDTLVLKGNAIWYYRKESSKLFKIVGFPSQELAKKEFNRETNSYRGCGKNVWRPRASARVFYWQLITNC